VLIFDFPRLDTSPLTAVLVLSGDVEKVFVFASP
jgi:hypothetical protein